MPQTKVYEPSSFVHNKLKAQVGLARSDRKGKAISIQSIIFQLKQQLFCLEP